MSTNTSNTKSDNRTDNKESRDWSTEVHRIEDRVTRVIRDFLSDHGFISGNRGVGGSESRGSFVPRVDLYEGDKEYTLKADLPGINKSDIQMEVVDNTIRISGEHKPEDEGMPLLRERVYGNFFRNVSLPSNAKMDDIMAFHENGVLRVKIGKSEERKSKSVQIG